MNKFNGPVFIVGMPRSGTKLFRELLNNHSKLAFPPNESEILPYWSKNWHVYGDLTKFENFKRFYDEDVNESYSLTANNSSEKLEFSNFDLYKDTVAPASESLKILP